jgi:hypothetical protein
MQKSDNTSSPFLIRLKKSDDLKDKKHTNPKNKNKIQSPEFLIRLKKSDEYDKQKTEKCYKVSSNRRSSNDNIGDKSKITPLNNEESLVLPSKINTLNVI